MIDCLAVRHFQNSVSTVLLDCGHKIAFKLSSILILLKAEDFELIVRRACHDQIELLNHTEGLDL